MAYQTANEDEIEMTLAVFSDECEALEERQTILVHLPFRIDITISIAPSGYPESSYPEVFLVSSLNTQTGTEFMHTLLARIKEEIPLGIPMLSLIIPLAQSLAEEMQLSRAEEEEQREEEERRIEAQMLEEESFWVDKAVDVWVGEPVSDRRSKFVAHMARVTSLEEVEDVVGYLRSLRHIACAAHPTIWAYRFTDKNGVLQQDTDDDGESGASIKMMFLLDNLKVDGYVVVVTRWFGGILLGPDRFKHIMQVTKDILLTIPEREKESHKSKKGKNK